MDRNTAARTSTVVLTERAKPSHVAIAKLSWRRIEGPPNATVDQLKRAARACNALVRVRVRTFENGENLVECSDENEQAESLFDQAVSDVIIRDRIADVADEHLTRLIESAIYQGSRKR